MTFPNIVTLQNQSKTNGLLESANTDSKFNKRNIAIAVGVIIAISLIAVALFYAEVKWGLLSAGLTWTLANPLIGAVVTLLVIGVIAYVVYRYLKTSVPESNPAFFEGKVASAHATYLEAKRKFTQSNSGGTEGRTDHGNMLYAGHGLREGLIEAELGLRNAVENLSKAIKNDNLYSSIVDKYPYDCSEFLTLQEQ